MFTIHKTIKGKPPSLPFLKIKEIALGKKYDLELIFIGSTRSKTLNKKYRGKNKPANILSFSISENKGEIFIDLNETRKTAKVFKEDYKTFTCILFIHGMLHLKGFEHGSRMECEELKIRKKINL